MTQSQASVIKFSSLFFLPPKVSDSKLGVDGWSDASSKHFRHGRHYNAFHSTFTWHKFKLLSSSSVLYFFYHLKSPIANLVWTVGGCVHPTFSPRGILMVSES